MNLKKILRIVWVVIYWFILGYLIGLCVLGKNTIIVNIVLGFYAGSIIIYTIKYIIDRISYTRTLKNIKLLFYYFSQSHKQRYYCYLNADTKGVEEFEELMNMCSDAILKTCPFMIRDARSIKKEREELQKIMDNTKKLLQIIQPPV